MLEELVRRFEPRIAIAALGASATAISISRVLLGDVPDFHVDTLAYAGGETRPLYFVLGAIAGIMAIVYNRTLLATIAAAERFNYRPVQILPRKFTLPGVGLVLAAGGEFIAPGIFGTVEPAARGKFPFGFSRQILASPACVGERVYERDLDHWMVVEICSSAHRDAANRRPSGRSTTLPNSVDRLDARAARTPATPHKACAAARLDSLSDPAGSQRR